MWGINFGHFEEAGERLQIGTQLRGLKKHPNLIPRFPNEKNVNIPIPSMYGIFTYIWWIFMVNVGKYTIHGCYGI